MTHVMSRRDGYAEKPLFVPAIMSFGPLPGLFKSFLELQLSGHCRDIKATKFIMALKIHSEYTGLEEIFTIEATLVLFMAGPMSMPTIQETMGLFRLIMHIAEPPS
jgi:hypothetical protein